MGAYTSTFPHRLCRADTHRLTKAAARGPSGAGVRRPGPLPLRREARGFGQGLPVPQHLSCPPGVPGPGQPNGQHGPQRRRHQEPSPQPGELPGAVLGEKPVCGRPQSTRQLEGRVAALTHAKVDRVEPRHRVLVPPAQRGRGLFLPPAGPPPGHRAGPPPRGAPVPGAGLPDGEPGQAGPGLRGAGPLRRVRGHAQAGAGVLPLCHGACLRLGQGQGR